MPSNEYIIDNDNYIKHILSDWVFNVDGDGDDEDDDERTKVHLRIVFSFRIG